ncbi:NUDIX domain-containing protein [Aliiglaciecola sp. CAU 1673]|nr:NUDIX domain-containing protein [Aliiglaciecola sp. CAU 1673]MDF2180389.1 NUDIX domain-containing protein [Aliiglaciecola sp. CAU 1673]
MLTIAHRHSDRQGLPSDKVKTGESAQCAAHRATWETTGFNVEVGTFLGADSDGVRVYGCQLQGSFGAEFVEFPVPAWAEDNIQSIKLIDPYEIQFRDWQKEEDLLLIRAYFDQVE